MREFFYEAYEKDGAIERDRISAASQSAAYQALEASGKTPFLLGPVSGSSKAGGKTITGRKRLVRKDFAQLFPEIAVLLRSGFTIDQALTAVEAGIRQKNGSKLSIEIHNFLKEGSSVSAAFSRAGAQEGIAALLAAGEASGKLADVFSAIARNIEEDAKRSAAIREALLYPAFLIGVMLLAVGVLTFYLIPAIEPIFEASGSAKPFLFTALDRVRGFLSGGGWLVSIVLLAVVAVFAVLPSGQNALKSITFRLPAVGRFFSDSAGSQYLRTLSMLLDNGVNVKEAMRLSASTSETDRLRSPFDAAARSVEAGSSLTKALDDTGLFARGTIAYIRLGEASDNLSEMLARCAMAIELKQKRRIDRAMTILTPAITITLGVMVGALIISVMTALLSINEIAIR